MIKEIDSDIFEAPIDILVHQANCFTTMGSGIAKEIKARFPEAYRADLATSKGDINKLGTYSRAKVANIKYPQIKYIVNLYGQFEFGTDKQQTDYVAVKTGLIALATNLKLANLDFLTIGIPYKMSCGLAGGSWVAVWTIIQLVFEYYKGDVLICKMPDKDLANL